MGRRSARQFDLPGGKHLFDGAVSGFAVRGWVYNVIGGPRCLGLGFSVDRVPTRAKQNVSGGRLTGVMTILPGSWSKETFRGVPAVEAEDAAAWRRWLAEHAETESRVWLVMYRQQVALAHVRYPEAVEQALCFGWVDSHKISRSADSSYQQFTPRNPRSTWSRINRERAERMIRLGEMRESGRRLVELARQTGTWSPHPDADAGIVPADLAGALAREPAAKAHFDAFPPFSRRLILSWIAQAKRPETRTKRVLETVTAAEQNIRAHHPRGSTEPGRQSCSLASTFAR